jgi:DNA-binding CsgD family transcriptional regulator
MQLTLTEKQIISLKCDGCTNEEISKELFISHRTVKRMLESLRERFECKNSTALCAKWLKQDNKAA